MTTVEDELKALLLEGELSLLDRLQEETRRLGSRIGDDEALRDSSIRVIADVLKQAGVRDHQRMADALAPLVLQSLRQEIRNSRDLMVDALYPITGRLVAAAVRSAFRQHMQALDKRLNATLSLTRWKLRLEAWATGQSEAALLLRRYPPFLLQELFVIDRGAGVLLARSSGDPNVAAEVDPDGPQPLDSDLVGAMLTAILSFVSDTFGADGGDLRRLAFGDGDLFLRTSPAIIIALKTSGTPPPGFDEQLDPEVFGILERWGDDLRDQDGALDETTEKSLAADLAATVARMSEIQDETGRRTPVGAYVVVMLVIVAIAGLIGWSWWEESRIAAVREKAAAAIATEEALQGFPVETRFDPATRVVTLTGLFPDQTAIDRTEQALGAVLASVEPPVSVSRGPVAALPPPVEIPPFPPIPKPYVPPPPTALENLEAWVDRNIVILGETGRPALAAQWGRLQELVSLMAETDPAVRLRILAFADPESGTPTGRRRQAQEDGEAVRSLLADLGIDPRRLSVAARAGADPLTTDPALAHTNRRIAFDIAYPAEPDGTELARRVEAVEAWTAKNAPLFGDETSLANPAETEAALAELAALMARLPASFRLRLTGHTDPTGSDRLNNTLAIERAVRISEMLADQGIDTARLVLVGNPSTRPPLGAPEPDITWRRVAFTLLDPRSSEQ